jgi:hypothetical protein
MNVFRVTFPMDFHLEIPNFVHHLIHFQLYCFILDFFISDYDLFLECYLNLKPSQCSVSKRLAFLQLGALKSKDLLM